MSPLRYGLGGPFWSFGSWNGGLYSQDAQPGDRLRQYARVFNTVEGNTTFYHAPSERTAESWRAQTPPGFRFCFKLPRELTHDALLRDVERPLAAFLDALAPLADRLGAFLLQLPPAFGPERLGDLDPVLERLRRTSAVAVELRHRAFFDHAEVAARADARLAAHGADRVMMDTRALRAGNPRHPEVLNALHQKPDLPLRATPIGDAPFVRWVGHPEAAPNEPFLDEWAERVAGWIAEGRRPLFFVHTASNRNTPAVARDFHRRVSKRVDAGTLPPFPGEAGERADGQLALLPLADG